MNNFNSIHRPGYLNCISICIEK